MATWGRDAFCKAVPAYHVFRVYADAISRPAQKGVFPQFPRETRPMPCIGKTPVKFMSGLCSQNHCYAESGWDTARVLSEVGEKHGIARGEHERKRSRNRWIPASEVPPVRACGWG